MSLINIRNYVVVTLFCRLLVVVCFEEAYVSIFTKIITKRKNFTPDIIIPVYVLFLYYN